MKEEQKEYPKIKKRYKLLGQYLPFQIEGEPFIIEKHQVGSPDHTIINTANDEFLIYDFNDVSYDSI